MSNHIWESVKKHAPLGLAILAAAAGTAAVGFAIHDTFKLVEKHPEFDDNVYLHKKSPDEIFKKAVPCYIPTIASWLVFVTALASSTALNEKQKASMIGAYLMATKAYSDYVAKNRELFGDENHQTIVEEMAKDRYVAKAHPTEGDTKLYYEGYFGEYFESTPEKVLKAEYELNHLLMMNEMVTLCEFFDLLDLPPCEQGDLGWSTWKMFEFSESPWIEVRHDPVILDDGLECEILEFIVPPAPDYADDM